MRPVFILDGHVFRCDESHPDGLGPVRAVGGVDQFGRAGMKTRSRRERGEVAGAGAGRSPILKRV